MNRETSRTDELRLGEAHDGLETQKVWGGWQHEGNMCNPWVCGSSFLQFLLRENLAVTARRVFRTPKHQNNSEGVLSGKATQ